MLWFDQESIMAPAIQQVSKTFTDLSNISKTNIELKPIALKPKFKPRKPKPKTYLLATVNLFPPIPGIQFLADQFNIPRVRKFPNLAAWNTYKQNLISTATQVGSAAGLITGAIAGVPAGIIAGPIAGTIDSLATSSMLENSLFLLGVGTGSASFLPNSLASSSFSLSSFGSTSLGSTAFGSLGSSFLPPLDSFKFPLLSVGPVALISAFSSIGISVVTSIVTFSLLTGLTSALGNQIGNLLYLNLEPEIEV